MQEASHNLMPWLNRRYQIHFLFEKSKNGQEIRTLNFPRVIAFCVKKLGVIVYGGKLITTRFIHWKQYLRFGRVVFEKSKKNRKKNGQKLESLIFARVITFMQKNVGITANEEEPPAIHSTNWNARFGRVVSEKSQKDSRNCQKIKNLTFREP